MSNNELSTEISPEIINSLILTGDMSQLKPAQQTQYYNAICNMLGISPLTQPFAIIVYQGKKTLYARKDCTQQLSNTRKISTEVKERKSIDSVYIVSVRASMPEGRFTDDDGIVSISGLKGLELANAMMKATTKAKRRAVLALCGLGMPDETEIEDMPNTASVDNTKSRVEQIIDTQCEEVNDVQEREEINKGNDRVKEVKKDDKSKNNNEESKSKTTVGSSESVLPEGHKTAQGIITTPAKQATVDRDGKPTIKWSFTMDDNKYGTFDEKIFKGISEILDLQKDTPILINIEYKKRLSGEKILRDIVSFSQVIAKQVPI